MFGKGTGVAFSLWSPVRNKSDLNLINPYPYQSLKAFRCGDAEKFLSKRLIYRPDILSCMSLLKERKGSGLGSSGEKGKLKKLLEGSTIVDLLTLGVLAYSFTLLKDSGYGSSSLFAIPGSQEMLAAQLTALVIAIYVIEAIIDSAGE